MIQEHDWKPHLFGHEEELLRAEMSRAKSYLEFGVGGSTLLAARCGISSIVGVDSDPAWVAKTRTKLLETAPSINTRILHCDIGPTGKWGAPLNSDKKADWPEYFKSPWRVCVEDGKLPTFIYVDGRFRVACALYSIQMLRAKAPGLRGRIAIHDFTTRPHYGKVLDYADVKETVDTLVVLEAKEDLSPEQLAEDLEAYEFNPA